ncbi:MAG: hypothetical protein ABIT01_20640, partial [Thermoanaerobaculia bacterium]
DGLRVNLEAQCGDWDEWSLSLVECEPRSPAQAGRRVPAITLPPTIGQSVARRYSPLQPC